MIFFFLITGLFNISLFSYFFVVTESTCVLLSTLPDSFSLTSRLCPSLFPLLPTLGENRHNIQDCDISWFIKSSLRYLNPPVILRWMLYKSTAKELKEKKKCNCAALTQIAHFKLRPEVSNPPNYPESLFLKPRGYMFMYCRIRPPLYLTLWVMLSKKVGLFNKE